MNVKRTLATLGLLTAFAVSATSRESPAQPNPTPSLAGATRTNSFYLNNRAPLAAAPLLPLPSGSVKAKGWL